MTFDPDAHCAKQEQVAEAEQLLSKLQSCDLTSDWDTDFVNDLTDKIAKFGSHTTITPLQWEQLERLRKQHGL